MTEGSAAGDAAAELATRPARTYKYFDYLVGAFVAVLLCSNLIGASKVAVIGGFEFGAGVMFFPLTYLFGDLFTEVYGYAHSRRAVWAGFGALAFASLMSQVVLAMPPAQSYAHQAALEAVFGSTWRIMIASLAAYFSGEFLNSYVLARMKVATRGRFLWARTIGSTIAGEAADTLIFYPLAFLGQWEVSTLLGVMLANYLLKVGWEVLATPFTYRLVGWLKRKEHEDYFDVDTRFSPFAL